MSASRLTWRDEDRTFTVCALCRMAVRVYRNRDRLSVHCFGGCREAEVRESLDVGRILAELGVPAGTNGDAPSSGTSDRYEHRVLDVAALLAAPDEPIPWRCEGIAADGYLTVLAGRGGEGKSWMALALACGVARGRPTAGIRCEQGTALIFDAENGPKLIARRLRAAQVSADLAVQPVDAGGLRFSQDLDWMREMIEREGASLVVFDSLRVLSSGAKESDADEMEPIITRLKQLARDTGAAVVLIHHRGKSEVNDYRGSSVILDQTDMLFTLGRVPGDPDGRHRRKLTTVKCRIDEEPEPRWTRIEADRARGLVTVDEADPYESEGGGRPRDGLREQVLDQLTGTPQLQARIAAGLGRDKSDQTVRRVLRDLKDEGLAERRAEGWVKGGCHPDHLGSDNPDNPPEKGFLEPREGLSLEPDPDRPLETDYRAAVRRSEGTTGAEARVNGSAPEAAEAFIQRAHEVFPGSYEMPRNGRA